MGILCYEFCFPFKYTKYAFAIFSGFQVQSKASTVSSGTRASAIINSNSVQQQSSNTNNNHNNHQQQMHSRNSISHEQEKSSRVRRRSVSPSEMENGSNGGGADVDSYYQPQNGNYNQQQSMNSASEQLHRESRSSINQQDVSMSRESPYSKDIADHMTMEENGHGNNHSHNNGTSSKYSLLQFAAQHFRNE